MVCCGSHNLIETPFSQVCTECGKEHPLLVCDTYNINSAPMPSNYDRTRRFKVKCMKLLLIQKGPKYTDDVWTVLRMHQEKITSCADIRKLLRASKIKHKHYDFVRLFSKVFNRNHRVVHLNPIHALNQIMLHFDEILFRWKNKLGSGLFFSSDWLLRRLCTILYPSLVCFLKPRTSRQRHQKYMKMMFKLFANVDENQSRVCVTGHFLNA